MLEQGRAFIYVCAQRYQREMELINKIIVRTYQQLLSILSIKAHWFYGSLSLSLIWYYSQYCLYNP